MYSLLPAFVSVLFLGFGLYVLTTEGVTRVSIPFAGMCAATFVWQGAWAFLFQTTSAQAADILVKVGYLFILFLPTTLYHFSIEIVSRHGERPALFASYALCVALAILLATGNGIVDGYSPHFFGDYPKAGRLHPIHVVQTLAVVCRSAWLIYSARRRARSGAGRRLLGLCLAGILVYSCAAADYAVNYGYGFYPPGFIFITLSLGIIALVRYGLLGPYIALATMAHEVATPLATIGLHAEELQAALPELVRGYRLAVQHGLCEDRQCLLEEPHRLEDAARAIRGQTTSANVIVEMSLASATLHRLDRRGFAAHSIGACIAQALDRFPFRAGERALVSPVRIDPDVRFFGSDTLLIFVLFNLLKNALQAIHAHGKGHIEIGAHTSEGYCILRFSDTGPGMPPDVLRQIFEPFYSTKPHGRGSGVGLTFCRRVCHAFGGSISCESELDVHTTFTLRLPAPVSPFHCSRAR